MQAGRPRESEQDGDASPRHILPTCGKAATTRAPGVGGEEAARRWAALVASPRLAVVGLGSDGRVTFVNQGLLSLTGYQESEVIGRDWFATFVPSQDSDLRAVFTSVLRGGGEQRHENPILTKAGEVRQIVWFNTALCDATGRSTGTLSIGEDVTEQARTGALLKAVNEVTQAVLADPLDDAVLGFLARWARQLLGAELATIVLALDDRHLVVAAADGVGAAKIDGMVFPAAGSVSGRVMSTASPECLDEVAAADGVPKPVAALGGIGPTVFVPLRGHRQALGTLGVHRGRGGRPFTGEDVELVTSFSAQVSVAVEYGRAQAELEETVLLEDHDRVARDLHDTVIQRIYGAGLVLQGVASAEPALADRLGGVVDQLDAAIRDLRGAIFGLGTTERVVGTLRRRLLEVAAEAGRVLGFEPEVAFDGPVETMDDGVAGHLVAVVRELLANVARHAHASRTLVEVGLGTDVTVRITDDGVGPGDAGTGGRGLRNLHGRAESLGGSFALLPGQPSGTEALWRVPRVPLGDDAPR